MVVAGTARMVTASAVDIAMPVSLTRLTPSASMESRAMKAEVGIEGVLEGVLEGSEEVDLGVTVEQQGGLGVEVEVEVEGGVRVVLEEEEIVMVVENALEV